MNPIQSNIIILINFIAPLFIMNSFYLFKKFKRDFNQSFEFISKVKNKNDYESKLINICSVRHLSQNFISKLMLKFRIFLAVSYKSKF